MSEPMQEQTEATPEHPHGYTLADEEMERLEEKRAQEDALDPIALDDPVGMSVEKVIGRALIFVVFVLVVGILFAQVACKNIQLQSVVSFSGQTVSSERVEKAISSGVSFAGEIVKFPQFVSADYDELTGHAQAVVVNDSPRTMAQLVNASQDQAFTLAMALFNNDDVKSVSYGVCSTILAPADDSSKKTQASQESDQLEPLVTFTWTRLDDGSYTCELTGYDIDTLADDGAEEE